ncbi:hypothetical protein ACFVJ4_42050 [Streptomyces sp. NPDC127178]|uniref:Mu transposase domain-containing protein n=1 Tax=unclassified Streptomyces TaxID=2593676 RepID=UPI00362ED5F7
MYPRTGTHMYRYLHCRSALNSPASPSRSPTGGDVPSPTTRDGQNRWPPSQPDGLNPRSTGRACFRCHHAPPGWWKTPLRLPRDQYVRLDTCEYSVHPMAVGRRTEVAADLDQVLVACGGVEVAHHARRTHSYEVTPQQFTTPATSTTSSRRRPNQQT